MKKMQKEWMNGVYSKLDKTKKGMYKKGWCCLVLSVLDAEAAFDSRC